MPPQLSAMNEPSSTNYQKLAAKRKALLSRDGACVQRFFPVLTVEQEANLQQNVKKLMEPGKGILAADDTVSSIDNCLRTMKLNMFENSRVKYLEVVLGASRELCHFISGVLVREEMSILKFYRGGSVAYLLSEAGIQLGVRTADKKYVKLPGTFSEWATQGLDNLEQDCRTFKDRGATFVLWRCVYKVTWCTPSKLALSVNSNTLARFASISQQIGLVPIVLSEGDHDVNLAVIALNDILTSLTQALLISQVYLEGLLVRLTPAFPGAECPDQVSHKDVVKATLRAINENLPPAVGGIMIARCDTLADSAQVLNELNCFPMKRPVPISFCFSRVILDEVINIWAGQEANPAKATNALVERAKMCSLASMCQFWESGRSISISKI